jgi:hypothetical protein
MVAQWARKRVLQLFPDTKVESLIPVHDFATSAKIFFFFLKKRRERETFLWTEYEVRN